MQRRVELFQRHGLSKEEVRESQRRQFELENAAADASLRRCQSQPAGIVFVQTDDATGDITV